MLKYTYSNTQTNLQSIAGIRQKPFGQIEYETVNMSLKNTKKVLLPYAHGEPTINIYKKNKIILDKDAKFVADLINGTIVLIATDGNKGVLVKLISDVKADKQEHLCIAIDMSDCTTHSHIYETNDCVNCRSAVKKIFNPNDLNEMRIQQALGRIIQPFYSLYRDCEILCDVDYNGIHGLSIIGRSSLDKRKHYWKKYTSS